MVISEAPMPMHTLPPSINAVPQSDVTPQTSASTIALPPYHWAELEATIDVLNQYPILKSLARAVASPDGKEPEDELETRLIALFATPNRLVVAVVELKLPLYPLPLASAALLLSRKYLAMEPAGNWANRKVDISRKEKQKPKGFLTAV